MAFCGK